MTKRRFWSFGLRGLLLAIIAIGLFLGWAAHKARRQRAALVAVRKFGGFVHYDYEFAPGPVKVAPGNFLWQTSWGTYTPSRKPWAPEWLRRAVGPEYFQELAHVSLFVDIHKGTADAHFYNIGPADDALQALSTQASVRTLHLGGQQVNDKNLAYVGKMTGLEELIIFPGRGITDAGLAQLAGLKKLRILLLTNSDVTDRGLDVLRALPSLRELSIEGKEITKGGRDRLKQALPRLERLD
jgi:hypothetical protein